MKTLGLLLVTALALSFSACGTCPKSMSKQGGACCGSADCPPSKSCPPDSAKCRAKKAS